VDRVALFKFHRAAIINRVAGHIEESAKNAQLAGSSAAGTAQAQDITGLGPQIPGANSQDKAATAKASGQAAAADTTAKQTAAAQVASDATANDAAAAAAAVATDPAVAKAATGLKTQAAPAGKTSAKTANATLDPQAPSATATTDPAHGKAVQAQTATDQQDANNVLGDAAKSPGQGNAAPSSHERSATSANPQFSVTTLDPSAQAATAMPQQVSSLSSATPTAATNPAQPASAPVPVSGLAVEIAASVQGGKTHFEVRLDPADLGRIDVRIAVDRNGQVTSHLTVEKPETLSLLRQDAPQLQQALNDAGLKTSSGGLQFSLRDQSSSGQNNGNNQQSPQPQRLIVSDDDSVSSAVIGRSYGRALGSSGGIDIRV